MEVEEQKILINKYHKETQRLNMQNKACQERIKVLERAVELACEAFKYFLSCEDTVSESRDYFISQAEKEKYEIHSKL